MKPDVKESAAYDNYLEKDVRLNDDYTMSLDRFFGDEISVPLPPKVKTKEEVAGVYKVLYVHFRNVDDMAEFCELNTEISSGVRYCLFISFFDSQQQ